MFHYYSNFFAERTLKCNYHHSYSVELSPDLDFSGVFNHVLKSTHRFSLLICHIHCTRHIIHPA
jgi:hypothetical protein